VKTFHAPTLTELNLQLCKEIVRATESQLDVISTVDVQFHNTISQAESMEWEFDLKDLWLTKSRWTMMCNQYLDREELTAWIEQCTGKIGTKGRGIAVLRTKQVKARGGAATGHTNRESRRWGSCMLAISYKAVPNPQITLYSRTSYLGYLGALDLSVAYMCGKYLADAMGVPVESFQFVWMNEALQFHNFKSMAFLLNHPQESQRKLYRRLILKKHKKLSDDELWMIKNSPALTLTRKWMSNMLRLDKEGIHLGQMNYNTYRRIRRRYHTEVKGLEFAKQFEGWSVYKTGPKVGENKEFFKAYQPLISVPVSTLDFSKLGLPLDGQYGVDYDGSDYEEEDDDD
jgi:hypothetical protein